MGEVGSDCVDESFVGKYTNVYGQSKRAAEGSGARVRCTPSNTHSLFKISNGL